MNDIKTLSFFKFCVIRTFVFKNVMNFIPFYFYLIGNSESCLLIQFKFSSCSIFTSDAVSICVFHSTAENHGKCSLSVNSWIPAAWDPSVTCGETHTWAFSYCAGFPCFRTKYGNHWEHTWFVSGFWELLCSIKKRTVQKYYNA